MTIIQPNKHQVSDSFVSARILLILVAFAMICSVVLVMLYHSTVSARNARNKAERDFAKEQNRTAELQEALSAAFNPNHVQDAVVREGLVVEKDPIYIKTSDSWEFASRY